MSACEEPVITYVRSRRRKTRLDVDLNIVPSSENLEQGGASARSQEGQQANTVIPQTIDLDEIDDDVIISSPSAFAAAKNNSRRTHGRRTVVVDVDSEEQSPSRLIAYTRNNRRRISANQRVPYYNLHVNLGESSTSMRENVQSVAAVPAPPPPPPKEPTFTCPVCMGQLVEEMSTKCGHIFCKACIKTAIAVQSKCPTCRKKITMKNTIRVYLPASK